MQVKYLWCYLGIYYIERGKLKQCNTMYFIGCKTVTEMYVFRTVEPFITYRGFYKVGRYLFYVQGDNVLSTG